MALQASGAKARMMMRARSLSALLAISAAAPVGAAGPIGTLERGHYTCELPGETAGVVATDQPEESFEIAGASRYRSPQGNGTYLRRGDRVIISSGPRNGTQYEVISETLLRRIENGQPGRLRCYWRGR